MEICSVGLEVPQRLQQPKKNAKNAGVITRILKGGSNIEAMALQAMLAKNRSKSSATI
jgi:hypothetical protein